MTKPTILVVEDEPAQMEVLKYNLDKQGYKVVCADSGEEGLLLTDETNPDLILLDWMLPNISGIEVCRQIKRKASTAHIPVIMLTARGEDVDKVRGLDIGADDYIVKPYSVKELMARVRVVLRRIRPGSVKEVLEHNDIKVDTIKHVVERQGSTVKLGPTEFRLLVTLIEHPGRVWSREQLLDRIWGSDIFVETRTVDVHVGRLRKALDIDGQKDPLRTIRGFGYALG